MPSKAQTNGMRGVYLVASELARRGLITSTTSRSARGADILATTEDCSRAFSVEVKTTTNNNFWQLAKHAKEINTKSHVYVFVHIKNTKDGDVITYYPVSSKFISKNAELPDTSKGRDEQYRSGYTIYLKHKPRFRSREIARFKDKWSLFGLT